jgi:hypothetical protein
VEAALEAEVAAGKDSSGEGPPPKKRRTTRKLVAWFFVDRSETDPKRVICNLGCLSSDNLGRLAYSAKDTPLVERHVAAVHPSFYAKFQQARNNEYNLATLEEEVQCARAQAISRVAKHKEHSDKFFRKINKGLENKVKCDLILMLWATANAVSRSALNCPIFDFFLRSVRAHPSQLVDYFSRRLVRRLPAIGTI